MNNKEFQNNIYSISFFAECITQGEWINDDLIPKQCVRFSWNKARKMIKEHDPTFYDGLCLRFFNPFRRKTYRSRDGKFLVITHSAIEYVFRIHRVYP